MSNYLKELLLNENVDIEVIKAIEDFLTTTELKDLEFELIFDATYRTFTEAFVYSGGNLSQKDFYIDSSKTTKIWQVDYTYNIGGELTQKDIQFVSNGQTLRITYTWAAGDLTQKDRSWV